MSIAQRGSRRRRPGLAGFLDRLSAVGALVLLVIFVLLGGGRALEDEDEDEE